MGFQRASRLSSNIFGGAVRRTTCRYHPTIFVRIHCKAVTVARVFLPASIEHRVVAVDASHNVTVAREILPASIEHRVVAVDASRNVITSCGDAFANSPPTFLARGHSVFFGLSYLANSTTERNVEK